MNGNNDAVRGIDDMTKPQGIVLVAASSPHFLPSVA